MLWKSAIVSATAVATAAEPNAAVQLIVVNFVLPDIVAKAINGMPTKRALAWGEDQVKLALQGKLRTEGKG